MKKQSSFTWWFFICVAAFLYIAVCFSAPDSYAHTEKFYEWSDDGTGLHRHDTFKGSSIRVDAPENLTGCADQYTVKAGYYDEDGNWHEPVMRDMYSGITNKVIGCIRNILNTASEKHFSETRKKVSKMVTALLTLYIIWFATKAMLGGVQNLRGEVMVVVFTSLGVSYFVLNTGLEDYIGLFIKAQEGLVDVVTRSIGSATACVFDNVWQRLDCTIGYIMGNRPDVIAEDLGILRDDVDMSSDPFTLGRPTALVPFAVALMLVFTPFGFLILMVGMAVAFLMIAAIVQALLIYITALIAVTFLGLIGPVVIPTILFGATRKIFKQWFQFLLAYTLQPALIMAFLAFMINVISFSMFNSGGLAEQYERVDSDAEKGKKSLVGVCSSTQEENSEECSNPVEKHSGSELGTLGVPEIDFYPVDETGLTDEEIAVAKKTSQEMNRAYEGNFLQNLFVMAILFGLTFSLMANVMNFGALLTGVAAENMAGVTNVFNTATKTVSDRLAFRGGGGGK